MTISPIKLISLNIEERRRLDLVRSFFGDSGAGIFCLQEVWEDDATILAHELGCQHVFAPMHDLLAKKGTANRKGIAIFTTGTITHSETIYYSAFLPGPKRTIDPELLVPDHCPLLSTEIAIDGATYSVANTHFMWSPNGEMVPPQYEALERLLVTLDRYPELILTGDFNCPRGFPVFDELAKRYTDNIPAAVTTTVDQELHRVKGLQLVIDGLFSSNHYRVSDVEVRSGVSDHCAIIGTVAKQ